MGIRDSVPKIVNSRRFIGICALATVFAFSALPFTAPPSYADELTATAAIPTINLQTVNANGTGYSWDNTSKTLTFNSGANGNTYTLTQSATTTPLEVAVVVATGVTTSITIQNINLETVDSPFRLEGTASLNLQLSGANKLKSNSTSSLGVLVHAGLNVPSGTALLIGGSGSLDATGSLFGAGIGCSNTSVNSGSITITGGTITAKGGEYQAGIGGSFDSNGGAITISGGTIVATGGFCGPGIGGSGDHGTGGSITINGGDVNATGGDNGAGIGGGWYGHGNSIVINDGTIVATGNSSAGIGGGYHEYGGSITINGGTVTAIGSPGAGIGGGSGKINDPGTVLSIASEANVHAFSGGPYGSPAIDSYAGNSGNGYYVNAKFNSSLTGRQIDIYANSGSTLTQSLVLPDNIYSFAYTTGAITSQNDLIRVYSVSDDKFLGVVAQKDSLSADIPSTKEAKYLDVVVAPVKTTGISVAPTSLILKKGESAQLTAMVTPSIVSDDLRWYEFGGVTVSPTGVVTATGLGSASINAASGTQQASCDIKVVELQSFSGIDRYHTAALSAFEAYPANADGVIIANGEGYGETGSYADALAASSLSGLLDYPILLSEKNSLPQQTAIAIEQLHPKTVIVLGGTNSISQFVESQLQSYVTNKVVRLGGVDRKETTVEIYNYGVTAVPNGWDKTAIFAYAWNFPDTISIAPFAAYQKSPIFLVDGKDLADSVKNVFSSDNFDEAIIVGGKGVVADEIESAIRTTVGGNVTRLGGDDRYQTSYRIASYLVYGFGMSFHGAGIATGDNFPDALVGAPLLGKLGSVLLLTSSNSTSKNIVTFEHLETEKDYVYKVHIFGGLASVSQAVRNDAIAKLGWTGVV